MSRLSFLTRIILNYGTDKDCPFCLSSETQMLARKKVLLQLRKCLRCGLRFRWPKETPSFSERFYQNSYKEVSFTTELPDDATLNGFLAANFTNSPKDFSDPIGVLKSFLPDGRVLDFGSSWGYGVYQLKRAGFDAFGFEISVPRAEMGRRRLGVEILDKLEDLEHIPSQSLDGIFASHVLEHLLSPREVFEFFARVLRPGGVVFILVPNSGGRKAREMGVSWPPMINEKHTLALDGAFFEKNMAPFGFDVSAFSESGNSADGEELRVIGRRIPVCL